MTSIENTITNQRTSKVLKAQLFLSAWLFLMGVGPLFFWGEFYFWPALIGGVWYVITKVMIWWNHG